MSDQENTEQKKRAVVQRKLRLKAEPAQEPMIWEEYLALNPTKSELMEIVKSMSSLSPDYLQYSLSCVARAAQHLIDKFNLTERDLQDVANLALGPAKETARLTLLRSGWSEDAFKGRWR